MCMNEIQINIYLLNLLLHISKSHFTNHILFSFSFSHLVYPVLNDGKV